MSATRSNAALLAVAACRVMAAWIWKKHQAASLLLLAICFGPLFWVSRYNYPSGDDYVVFTETHALGTLGATKWWYLNWSGRYANFFLQSLFPDYDLWLAAYTVIPIALFLIGFASVFYATRVFFGNGFAIGESFTIATCFYVFLVGITPDITTGFYWLPSNILYFGSVFTTLCILALWLQARGAASPGTRTALSAVAVFLTAVLAGLNEISIMLFIGVVGLLVYFQIARFRQRPGLAAILLACGVVFLLVAFLAPGNSIRANQLSGHGYDLKSLVTAIALTLYLFASLLSTTPLLLASGLYLVFLDANRRRVPHLFTSLSGIRWYSILIFLVCALTFTSIVLFTVIGVRSLAERVENVYAYSFTIGWFFVLTILFVNLSSAGFRFSLPKWAVGVMAAVVVLFLATGLQLQFRAGNAIPSANPVQKIFSDVQTKGVYANAYLDVLTGRAALYAHQNEETTKRFRTADGECVELLPISYPPKTVFIPFVKYPWTWCAKKFAPMYGAELP